MYREGEINLKELEKALGARGLEKELLSMSSERRQLMLEFLNKAVTLDQDALIRTLRYALYVKNTLPANRRNSENLNLGFSKGDSVA